MQAARARRPQLPQLRRRARLVGARGAILHGNVRVGGGEGKGAIGAAAQQQEQRLCDGTTAALCQARRRRLKPALKQRQKAAPEA